ncbi:MAG TPA: PQQ-dependent sugar dehydrogenase [Gaiellaceae bacterium]
MKQARGPLWILLASLTLALGILSSPVGAQEGPAVLDPNLRVRTVVSGLTTPSTMAFLGPNDFLIAEKNTGQVKRVVNGVVQGTVLDLAVNNASERGLLGVALHPDFPTNPSVYLYWTCRSTAPLDDDPFQPEEQVCSDSAMFGQPDTGDILRVPLRGNRVDRFEWDGSTLVYQQNLLVLRAFQSDGAPDPPGQGDSAQPARGNHDGGVLAFGADGKLYVAVGDLGRRGEMQNLEEGPTPPTDDDQFGGPEPDNAHLSGVVLRLNANGSAPADNPFFAVGAQRGGEAGANIQRLYAYGLRNTFGLALDPVSGSLWDQQNADDAFDELNRVERGMNGGWIQIMGPVSRIEQLKQVELTLPPSGGIPGAQLQQIRWPPTNLADTPAEALSRLFVLPGSHYSDPEFSWKFAVPPAAIGFLRGVALGPQYENDLFAGAATPLTAGGYLFRFNLTGNRRNIAVDDPRLEDRVADNNAKNDITESESLLFGTGFGVSTDIETAPNGNLFVVSLSAGAVYEISRR